MATLARLSSRTHFWCGRFAQRTFATTRSAQEKIKFEVSGQGTGVAQTIEIAGSPHKISVDAYPSFGGADSAPSPLAYNLSSLASCTQVTGSVVAKDLGIKLGQWNVAVNGVLDPKVLAKGEEGHGNWDSIGLNVSLQTDASGEQFEKFTRETERRCPITQLFKRSGVDWKSDWRNDSL